MPRYVDADKLREAMYHEAFETDTDMQKWDSGCWIRYKMFERAIEDAPTIDAVHVVRCENCQYWQPPTYQEQEDGSTVGHCTAALNGQQTDAYWFCADGTR